jgi:cobalamin-dependent methionine synthase I
MRKLLQYTIDQVEPYINWVYFYHAWQMNGKPEAVRRALRQDARQMLDTFRGQYTAKVVFGLFPAYSQGDDIVVENTVLPMLRQQRPSFQGGPCMCMADFIRPREKGQTDTLGLFVATVDQRMETEFTTDPFQRMLAQTLADRLAEAATERMHQEVRTRYWGYAPHEQLPMEAMLSGQFQGIRPAVGYPSLPDASINFLIDRILDMGSVGVRLTESGAMRPHASVSGLMIAHPLARYFDVGAVAEDQLADYALRRGIPLEMARRFLAANII